VSIKIRILEATAIRDAAGVLVLEGDKKTLPTNRPVCRQMWTHKLN